MSAGFLIILGPGVINLLLVLALFLSEYRVLNVPQPVRRGMLTVLFISALIHGTLAMLSDH